MMYFDAAPSVNLQKRTPLAKKLLIAAAAPAVFIVILEMLLFFCGVEIPRYSWHRGGSYHYFVPYKSESRPDGYRRAQPRSYLEELPLFVKNKPANGFRIFVLGESSVQGLPYTSGVFCDWLRLRLQKMLPDRSVEVINAGNRGWVASMIEPLLEECLEKEPDVLVWMVGHNEFFSKNTGALRFELEHPVQDRIRKWTSRLRTAALLRSFIIKEEQAAPERDREANDDREVWGIEYNLVKTRFDEITNRCFERCKSAKVQTIACTMPRNAREMPPFGSYFKLSTRSNAEQFNNWRKMFETALQLIEKGQEGAALTWCERAKEIDDTPAKLQFTMAQLYEKSGNDVKSRDCYIRALEQDGFPIRAQEWVQKIIKERAARNDMTILDLEAIFDGRAKKLGLAGYELITDNVHPNLAGHERIADEILNVMESKFHIPLDRGRDVSPAAGRELLLTNVYNTTQALRAEAVNEIRLVLQSGDTRDLWNRVKLKCDNVLAANQGDYEIQANLGLLYSLKGEKTLAKDLLTAAFSQSKEVSVMFLYYYKTQEPYKKAFDACGFDAASAERSLDAASAKALAERISADH